MERHPHRVQKGTNKSPNSIHGSPAMSRHLIQWISAMSRRPSCKRSGCYAGAGGWAPRISLWLRPAFLCGSAEFFLGFAEFSILFCSISLLARRICLLPRRISSLAPRICRWAPRISLWLRRICSCHRRICLFCFVVFPCWLAEFLCGFADFFLGVAEFCVLAEFVSRRIFWFAELAHRIDSELARRVRLSGRAATSRSAARQIENH